MVPCGRLSWLLVCFWAHVKIVSIDWLLDHRYVLNNRDAVDACGAKLSRDSRCTELGSVTEAGRHSALTVCNGVDQTLIDLSSLTGHVDHHEPLTRPLYTSNSSGPLSVTLTASTYDGIAYLLLYEGLWMCNNRNRGRRFQGRCRNFDPKLIKRINEWMKLPILPCAEKLES